MIQLCYKGDVMKKFNGGSARMILVHPVGYQWVRTEKRNGRKLVTGYNRDYFDDAVAFLIPKRTNLHKLDHRSLDWMIENFS